MGIWMSVRTDGRQGVAAVWGWWWLIVLLAALGGTAGYVGSRQIEPVHEATTTLLVGDLSDARALTKQDVETSRTLASMYGTLIRRRPVLESVVGELGLRFSWLELRSRVHVDAGTNDTPVVVVAVFASSPTQAETIANAIADRAVEIVPASAGDRGANEVRSFASRQAREVRDAITMAGARVSRLEAALASAPTPQARSRLLFRTEQWGTLVSEWQATYASLQRALSSSWSPNTLHVLQAAEATVVRVRPDTVALSALGAIIGASMGFALTYTLALRRLPRWRHASRRGASRLAQLTTAPETMDLGQLPLSAAGDEIASLDPWVRELAGLGGR
jgi:capsular polysaccharide biosynthesis protein